MLTFRSILVLYLMLASSVGAVTLSGQARVVDGDTLVVGGERIRLFGIDAPELRQMCDPSGRNWACGAWASEVLTGLTANGVLKCSALDRDRYGRTVARCTASGRDIGAEMVRAGAATAYVQYSKDYLPQEAAAKAEARGMWSGAVLVPSDFRKVEKRQPAPTTCAIKGNVNAKGNQIYHMPGQRDYDATRISTAKGEAFFCSEAEARAAGFRAAKR